MPEHCGKKRLLASGVFIGNSEGAFVNPGVGILWEHGAMSANKDISTKQPYNSAGEGWMYLTQLDAEHSQPAGEGRAVPEVRIQERLGHVAVVRIAFRKGDVMADHHAPAPIMVLGQTGEVEFDVGGETLLIKPGTAVSVEANISHELRAVNGPATVTLMLITGPEA